MALLNREQFLSAQDSKFVEVALPELGGEVRIKSLSIAEQLQFEATATTSKSQNELVFDLILISCVDDDNKQMFRKEDLTAIKAKSASSITKLFKAILALNNLDEDEVDGLAKNS